MIAELASALLALAVFTCLILSGCGIVAQRGGNDVILLPLAKRLSLAVFALIGAAFLLLVTVYVQSDFSVANVLENSHTAKPLIYKITGSWGNHEGSMLLWVCLLSGFTAAYALTCRDSHSASHVQALALLGAVIAGFLLFVLLTSNPFARVLEPPAEGRDLNPLLQDIGLALHPPLLYLGYVGFAIVFASAVAALAAGQPIDSVWARRIRPWALLAWGFLTAGIGLGSWWAYRELGWGGWWFWDPVENISLLPWLAGTALVHCLLVLSQRPVLQNWTLLLAIFTFTFSLLGTFLVRSGLLTSVHSFASDPARGLYILAFIGTITGGSLWLYAARYPRAAEPDFTPVSREGGILLNNLLLATLCVTVLLGIIYPLLMQIFDLQAVSVGAPYYNTVVVPVALPLLLAAGIAPLLPWKCATWPLSLRALRRCSLAFLLVLVAAVVLFWPYLPDLSAMPMALFAGLAGIWMLGGAVAYGYRQRTTAGSLRRIPLHSWGMFFSHGGLSIFVIAATFASSGRMEYEHVLHIGEKLSAAGYEIELAALEIQPYDNYIRQRAQLHVTSASGDESFTLYPESRFYPGRSMETSESSIHATARRDVYTAIATAADFSNSKENKNNTISTNPAILRFYVVPAMCWLWLGAALTSLGGFVASFGYFRRYY